MPKNPGRSYADADIESIFKVYLDEEHPYSRENLEALATQFDRSTKAIRFVMRWFKPGVAERMPIKARNKIMRQAVAVREKYQAAGLIPAGK